MSLGLGYIGEKGHNFTTPNVVDGTMSKFYFLGQAKRRSCIWEGPKFSNKSIHVRDNETFELHLVRRQGGIVPIISEVPTDAVT